MISRYKNGQEHATCHEVNWKPIVPALKRRPHMMVTSISLSAIYNFSWLEQCKSLNTFKAEWWNFWWMSWTIDDNGDDVRPRGHHSHQQKNIPTCRRTFWSCCTRPRCRLSSLLLSLSTPHDHHQVDGDQQLTRKSRKVVVIRPTISFTADAQNILPY